MIELKNQAYNAAKEVIEKAKLKKGQILVIGCSTSEVLGETIGTNSSPEAAEYVFEGIKKAADEYGIFIAAQCCEHLNRALIVERECAQKYGWEEVCVVPQPKAGGSFATALYERMDDPVAVEFVKASAGLDIGGTLIGMHLKHVAVPLRLDTKYIGEATVQAARTRPKLIGGERAVYPD